MDPITLAIVTAIAAGATAGASEVGKSAIIDGYQALKTLLKKKYGSESQVVKSVDDLEADPESRGRQITLEEKVKAAKADQDDELLKATQYLQTLLDKLEAPTSGSTSIHQQAGDQATQIGTVGGDVNIDR